MHNNLKIISSIMAVLAAVICFVVLSIDRSLCSYADFATPEEFLKMEDICNEKYPISRFFLEIATIALLAYLVTFLTIKILRKKSV